MIGVAHRLPTRADLVDTLRTLVGRHRVPGAQLAVRLRGDTMTAEVGELEYGTGRPVTPETAFPIGSITKTFTATAAMILVADGDIELDEPIGEHLAELPPAIGRLTLRRLLSHTAGLVANPPEDADGTSLRRFVADHCGPQSVLLAPGTAFSYSNPGYLLVGRLVEVITGMDWHEVMASVVLPPLGIRPAFIGGADPAGGRSVATGHSANVATRRTRAVAQSLRPAEAPAGALAVSAIDLVNFGMTYLTHDVPAGGPLPREWAERMRQPVPGAAADGMADGWALGFAVFDHAGTRWVGHDGNADGTACYLRIDPDDDCVVALTTNASTGIGMWRELTETLPTLGIPVPPAGSDPVMARPVEAPAGCAGSYRNGEQEYVITVHDGKALLAIDGDVPERLIFTDRSMFWMESAVTGRAEFGGRLLRAPETGDVTAIQVGGRLAVRRA